MVLRGRAGVSGWSGAHALRTQLRRRPGDKGTKRFLVSCVGKNRSRQRTKMMPAISMSQGWGKNERDLRKLQHKRCSGSSCGEEEVKQNRERSGRRRRRFCVQLIATPKRVLIGNLL